jgi:hypothetical protein
MTTKKERAKPGTRLQQVLGFIRRQTLRDDGLLFTSQHANEAAEEFQISQIDVYNAVQTLGKKGVISVKKLGPGKGQTIKILNADLIHGRRKSAVREVAAPAPKGDGEGKGEATISDVLAGIDKEIAEIEGQIGTIRGVIADHEAQITAHRAEIVRKQELRAEIARLGGKH